jgi:hypothetical protein
MACPADEAGTFLTKHSGYAGETIFQSQRSPPETNPGGYQWALGQTTGFDHVGVHPQLNLPRNSQDFPVGNA